MDTKLKGDIAEIAFQFNALKLGFEILVPVGDRLSYDLVLVKNDVFIKIQVKSAWYSENDGVYLVDSRRTKTNRRFMKRKKYNGSDFNFAAIYVQDCDVFYIMPVDVFNSYAGAITLHENVSKQRKVKSLEYRNSWDLLKIYCGMV